MAEAVGFEPRLLSQHTFPIVPIRPLSHRLRKRQPGQASPRALPAIRPLTWQKLPPLLGAGGRVLRNGPLVNRVRAGRQQLSAGMAVCRSQPGHRTEQRVAVRAPR